MTTYRVPWEGAGSVLVEADSPAEAYIVAGDCVMEFADVAGYDTPYPSYPFTDDDDDE